MRHMYDSDGNIAYAGKVRASRRWKSSRPINSRPRKPRENSAPSLKAAEVELDTRTHQERIRDIINSSKWKHDYTAQ